MKRRIYNAREDCVDVQGSRMYYATFGKGTEPLVIIPGLSLKSIHGAAVPLALRFRIYVKDYRVWVFDKKEKIPEGITVRDLAADVACAMDKLGICNADILGVSQGGMIAQYLALDRPDLVRKLALGVTLSRSNQVVERKIGEWVGSAERNDYGAIVSDMLKSMYSEQYVKKNRLLFMIALKTAKLNDPERFIRLAKSCLTCDTYDSLDKIRCPVFVLGGKRDRIATAEASEEIAEKLGCPIYMYKNLGHSAYEEGKDFNKRVHGFFREEAFSKKS